MSDKVSFSQLVEELSKATGASNKLSNDFAHKLVELVKENAIDDGKASITNFGSFSVVNVAERQGVNPQNGETIIIPAHQRLSFTPFKALEQEVNKPFEHLESTVVGEDDAETSKPAPAPKPEPVKAEEKEEAPEPKASPLSRTTPRTYTRPGDRGSGGGINMTMVVMILLVFIIATAVWWMASPDSEDPSPIAQENTEQNDAAPAAEPADESDELTGAEEPTEPEATDEEEEVSEPVRTIATPATPPDPVMEEAPANSGSDIPTSYEVSGGEWFYDIARKVYGVPTLWPLIFEANYSADQNPDLIEPGPVLIIPGLDGTPGELTLEDEAKLQQAILMVAQAYRNAGLDDKATTFDRWASIYDE